MDGSPPIALPCSAVIARLVECGKLTNTALARASRVNPGGAERVEFVLTRLGLVAEQDLAEAFAAALELPLAETKDFPPAPVLDARLSRQFLRRGRSIPLAVEGDRLTLAMADPTDDFTADAIALVAGLKVARLVATASDIETVYERLYAENKTNDPDPQASDTGEAQVLAAGDVERLKDLASEEPVIRVVNQLISRAVDARASDIHIEPCIDRLRVRYRIDGALQDVPAPPLHLATAVVSRIKIMARLNIAERRLPQDDRIQVAIRGQEIDLRISTMPTMHGESVVMRILDRNRLELDFGALGFDGDILPRYLDVLSRPHGILLVTGPVGSGKTTTLYASLQRLNVPERKIITVENPIEYQIDGINQVQVKPQIGLTFASTLRSILRHDFDVLMIGEIRDSETVQSAIQAALMGRLVLSTLHTNDAASSITRLLNMGVEDYLLTSTVVGVAAQRLLRKLCTHCRASYQPSHEVQVSLQLKQQREQSLVLYQSKGCGECGGTGYAGRTMILELLRVSDPIRALILQRAEAREIHAAAVAEGMTTLFQHGVEKALAGVTTIEEVLRVTRED